MYCGHHHQILFYGNRSVFGQFEMMSRTKMLKGRNQWFRNSGKAQPFPIF